jgi:4,5-dihydroxyphthalate decarboxylase
MTLSAAIGRYKHTAPLFDWPGLAIEAFPVISRAFKPMVREQRFDVAEMAIATALQARAYGSDLVLLPVTMAARFQNGAMLRRANDPFGPADLAGKRVGVRAYSQTTGLWLRGIIQDDYGVAPDAMRWITFEDAHVAAYKDPPWAERAPAGADMLDMLRTGALDAAIFGAAMPDAPDLATVFPDPVAAAEAFWARHHLVPVNHMIMVTAAVARRPGAVRGLMDQFRAARDAVPPAPDGRERLPFGRAALDPAVLLAARYCVEQGLLPSMPTLDDIWTGLPVGCEE